jgi:hypothetical protein
LEVSKIEKVEKVSSTLEYSKFYVELDWPVIPNHLCDELINFARSAPNIWVAKDSGFKYEQYNPTLNLMIWVKEFLSFIPNDYRVRLHCIPKGAGLSPHIDAMRASSYNFVLTEDGGRTNWHGAFGQIVHSIHYKSKVWYHHQSRITHSVDSVNSPRIAVTIFKFEIQPWAFEKYPNLRNLHDSVYYKYRNNYSN